jgi:hypothetical protein
MVSTCQHCDKTRILIARVRSDILCQIVCHQCALLAARLLVDRDELRPVEGALTVEVFEDAIYRHSTMSVIAIKIFSTGAQMCEEESRKKPR